MVPCLISRSSAADGCGSAVDRLALFEHHEFPGVCQADGFSVSTSISEGPPS
jgi:hypothetical protein